MTEYTMVYTLEITEIHQAEEEKPEDLLHLVQLMREQEQRVREQLGADDVHLREYRVSVNAR
jgi:hypothetical protein